MKFKDFLSNACLGLSSPNFGRRYHNIHFLAKGGMAEVYKATFTSEEGFSKDVVIKKILSPYEKRPKWIESFLNEAKIMSLLTHSNLVQVYDFGKSKGNYFLAMEYVDGCSLLELQRKVQMLPEPYVLWMGLGMTEHWEVGEGVSFYPATSIVTSQKRVLFVIDGEGRRSEIEESDLLTPSEWQNLLNEGASEFPESVRLPSFRYRRTLGAALQSCENVSVILLGTDIPQWLPRAVITSIDQHLVQKEKWPTRESAMNRQKKGCLAADTVDKLPLKDLLSVTDVGMLLKCPFLFYAKKICF